MPEFKELKMVINSKLFTLEFYKIFISDYREAMFGFGSYENVKKTAFYNDDTCKYCRFLCEFTSCLPSFIIKFYDEFNNLVSTRTGNFENLETAKRYYEPMESNYKVEVVKY